MDWYEATNNFHRLTFKHECKLSSLPEEWQRELAALWRLNSDVNNGGYLQFLTNWGIESYAYASQSLRKIGAKRLAEIVGLCQALVGEHFDIDGAPPEEWRRLTPNAIIHLDGSRTEARESILPRNVLTRISELSFEFMDHADDLATLGWSCYRPFVERYNAGSSDPGT